MPAEAGRNGRGFLFCLALRAVVMGPTLLSLPTTLEEETSAIMCRWVGKQCGFFCHSS